MSEFISASANTGSVAGSNGMNEPQGDSPLRSHQQVVRQLLDGETEWDRRLIGLSNKLNPILLKETRQALKSSQFSLTFLAVIFITALWTSYSLLMAIPTIYYAPNGQTLLFGYVWILLLPAIVVVPLSSFNSMASELQDGTFETLSLSLLTPSRIVYGKLSVAALQLSVYLSILAPSIVMTYMLRGVSLVSLIVVLVLIVAVSIGFCSLAIMLATLSRTSFAHTLITIFLLLVQVISVPIIASWSGSILFFSGDSLSWSTASVSYCVVCLLPVIYLLLTIARVRISDASVNKSTPVRLACLLLSIVVTAAAIFAGMNSDDVTPFVLSFSAVVLAMFWTCAGCLMVAEQGFISIRTQRTLPDNLLSRVFLTWFVPGAGTGFVFSTLTLIGCFVSLVMANVASRPSSQIAITNFVILLFVQFCYVVVHVGIARIVAAGLRPKVAERTMLLTALVMLLIHVVSTVMSYAMSSLSSNSGLLMSEWFSVFNPYWTITDMTRDLRNANMIGDQPGVILILIPAGVLMFLLNLLFASRGLTFQRIATPQKVEALRAEGGRGGKDPAVFVDEVIDPLA